MMTRHQPRWQDRLVAAMLLVAGTARAGHAVQLFTAPGGAGTAPAPGTTAQVTVIPSAAESLARARQPVALDDVPLAGGGRASFHVAPVDLFAADARVVAFDGVTERPLGLPDVSVYEGGDVANPERRIVVSVVDGADVWAVVREGTIAVTAIEPSREAAASGAHAVLDPAKAPLPSRPLCDTDRVDLATLAPLGVQTQVAQAPSAATPPGPPLAIEVLVDVGYDLFTNQLGASTARASTYAANVFGAVSAIYRRDVDVAVLIKQLVIWTGADPFGGADSGAQLQAYRSWSMANRTAVPRDVSHLLANLNLGGGIAYINTLCDGGYGYAVSNLDGFYSTFPSFGYLWDVNVTAHELGHNVGSVHTHCYNPPIDRCYNQEPGCYSGPVVSSVGETMSYCHLLSDGGIEMGFGATVGGVIRTGAATASCVGSAPGRCGNGVVEAGEQCDDGNTVNGDCCSATCTYEGPTTPCTDDGDPCTSDVCGGGTCTHVPPGSCTSCGAATAIPPSGGTVIGTTSGAGTLAGTCGASTSASPERVFSWTPADSGTATITTCSPATSFDTVLYVRSGSCDSGAEVACVDDDSTCASGGLKSTVALSVTEGQTYYLVVDGYSGAQGAFALQVIPPLVPPSCGDGIVNAGEECDDGNTNPADGCTNGCTVCGNGIVTPPEQCDDGNLAGNDTCSASCTIQCPPTPTAGCRTPTRPGKAKLQLKDRTPDSGDELKWTWGSGAATSVADFGNPSTTDRYAVCMYAGGGLVLGADAPAGGLCGTKPCWTTKSTGFMYADNDLTPNGLAKLDLKAGDAGRAKIKVEGKGVPLAMPSLATLASPVRIQVLRAGVACWEATFSAPFDRQDDGQFKDASD